LSESGGGSAVVARLNGSMTEQREPEIRDTYRPGTLGTPRARTLITATLLGFSLVLSGCAIGTEPSSPAPQLAGEDQRAVDEIVERSFEDHDLVSLIGEIVIDGETVAQFAHGEAYAGHPATADHSFRNGAVAIAYLSIALLRLSERGELDLDAPIAPWLPDLPDADVVTPRMLITMTSGYPDFVADEGFLDALVEDPFREWSNRELIEIGLASDRVFEPGTNWDYSHTGIVVLGEVISRASGKPLREVLQEEVLEPAGLKHTFSDQTAAIPKPLHAFTAERGVYEDSTYWNPSWTLANGAVQTTTVGDMASSFDRIIGRGELLEHASWQQLIAPDLIGFGAELDGCRTCHTLTEEFSYGLGVFHRNGWIAQTPLFGGYSASVTTLPAPRSPDGRSLTIAVAAVVGEDGYEDWTGALPNWADTVAVELAEALSDSGR